MTSMRRGAILLALLIAGLAVFVGLRFRLASDITDFLPSADGQSSMRLIRALAEGPLSRTMVLTVAGPDPAAAVAGARALAAALEDDPVAAAALDRIETGPPAGIEEAIWTLYHPRRFGFGDGEPLDDARLTAAAERLRDQLARPTSTLLTRVAPGDPLLALPDLFAALEASRGDGLRVRDGQYLGREGRTAVLFLTTRASAFDAETQGPLLDAIDRAFAAVDDGGLTLEMSALARFAVTAERAIKADIQRVSTLSTVGLLALMLLLFGSLRLMLLVLVPVGAGMLAGCAAALLVWGRLHSITLAFGAALIGVAVDYVVHLYCHHAAHPDGGSPREAMAHIWPAVATGAATSCIGFAALAFAPLGGLREVALFSVVGIGMALLATRIIVPGLMPATARPMALRRGLVAGLAAVYRWLGHNRRVAGWLPVIAVAAFAFAAPRVQWNADFAGMQRLDPALLAEDERVRARVALVDQSVFVAAIGPDDEAALRANDAVAEVLAAAREAGEIDGFRTSATLLPSAARQAAAAAVYFEPGVWDRFVPRFEAAGFRAVAFEPFREALAAGPPDPVTHALLADGPLAPLLRPFRLALAGEVVYLSFLRGVRDPAALAARLEAVAGARLVDQKSLMTEANRVYQQRTLQTLLLGLAGVLLLLGLRYRRLRPTLAAFVPAVAGALLTVALLTALGVGLDLVSLTALLMVVSMGVDFGVFLVDARASRLDEVPPAMLSVVVACASTVLGFGLLALSEHPVLFGIGATLAIGVPACLVMAPSVLVQLEGRDG